MRKVVQARIGRRETPPVLVVGCTGLHCRKVSTADMSEPANDRIVEEDIAAVVPDDDPGAGKGRRADGFEVDKLVAYRDGMAGMHFDKVNGCHIADIDRTCVRGLVEEGVGQDAEDRWKHEVDAEMAKNLVCIDYLAYQLEGPMVQR